MQQFNGHCKASFFTGGQLDSSTEMSQGSLLAKITKGINKDATTILVEIIKSRPVSGARQLMRLSTAVYCVKSRIKPPTQRIVTHCGLPSAVYEVGERPVFELCRASVLSSRFPSTSQGFYGGALRCSMLPYARKS